MAIYQNCFEIAESPDLSSELMSKIMNAQCLLKFNYCKDLLSKGEARQAQEVTWNLNEMSLRGHITQAPSSGKTHFKGLGERVLTAGFADRIGSPQVDLLQ